MAGQAKRDPATQRAHVRACKESHGRADARLLGGRLKAGHDVH
jgi:hypothetical protein